MAIKSPVDAGTYYCNFCGHDHYYGVVCSKRSDEIKNEDTTLAVQVDGEHYKNLEIQPALYSYKNKLGWHEGEIVKYVSRHRNKNGKVDLEKARHLIDMLIEFEYGSS